MIQKRFNIHILHTGGLLIALAWSVSSCFQPNVPLSRKSKYDLDLFWKEEKPDRPFQIIDQVSVQQETLLTAEERNRKGAMVRRGNDAREKERLTQELVRKAQDIGANAVMDVTYQYYTTATTNGYIMQGTAVLYRGN